MKKIALVVQRYGIEVNGGAEYHARMLAEKLASQHTIEILTSKAMDYNTWQDFFEKDLDVVNGIMVRRFSAQKKNFKKFRAARRAILGKKKYYKILKFFGLFGTLQKKYNWFRPSQRDGKNFIDHHGPNCPALVQFLKQNQSDYDCFIFFTYLYYPSFYGLQAVGDKSIFIPTAHDEPLLYTIPYQNIFSLPKFIMYNTVTEKELVKENFINICPNQDVAGIGIVPYLDHKKHHLESQYLFECKYFVYIGRVDVQKGCEELIDFFTKSQLSEAVKLVFIGRYDTLQDFPKHPDLIFTGFVDEHTKYQLLERAVALVIPSKFESLSLVTLEAMAQNKLVLANKHCEVIAHHIQQSKAGYLYDGLQSFASACNTILRLSPEQYNAQAKQGAVYVQKKYSWEIILKKFGRAIEIVSG